MEEYIDAVKNGEIVRIDDGNAPVATLEPARTIEQTIERLVQQGVIERGSGLPPDFFSQPPVDLGEGVLEQFLDDRRHDR